MASPVPIEASKPAFFIGQHEPRRPVVQMEELILRAQDADYDMVTMAITTPRFHSKILSLLSEHLSELDQAVSPQHVADPLVAPFQPADTVLKPGESVGRLLAFTSPLIDLCSPDPLIANVSRQVFMQEITFAAFCGVTHIVIQGPYITSYPSTSVAQYARAIQEALVAGPYLQLMILMPMAGDPRAALDQPNNSLTGLARARYLNAVVSTSAITDHYAVWDVWDEIRSVCSYNTRLCVALNVPRQLPPLEIQNRWRSESLRLLVLPANSFLKNAKGYPVLSKQHQSLIYRYMRLKMPPWYLLTNVGPIPGLTDSISSRNTSPASSETPEHSPSPTPAEASQMSERLEKPKKFRDPTPHLSYLRYLQRSQPPQPAIERFAAGYQDYLQAPLQPLADNLESVTYEVFEKDPIKYDWYERAIARALNDWEEREIPTSAPDGKVVVAVVGAGRGPLVSRALRASEDVGVEVEVWAVEKNPNAYVVLQRHNEEDWGGRVTVVKSDMRHWRGPMRGDGTYGHVDILVSELLGSFADNELSPECLDGVQHVLNPNHGISIPASYTAHITPIAAPRLHADVKARSVTDTDAAETPYVVMLQAIDYLACATSVAEDTQSSATSGTQQGLAEPDIQLVWSFSHPLPPQVLKQSYLRRGGSASGGSGGATGGDGSNAHNTRISTTRFSCRNRGVCHGLAGYFETVLYAGVELSTNPLTMDVKSPEMISWFPIYFPLKIPLYIPDNAELEVTMWRQTDDRKVWYEWLVEAFITIGDTRIRLGISDLHSSKKTGCVM